MRIDRELAAAVLDAQVRDWVAERPDRVGFARLGQARHEVYTAARRYRAARLRLETPLVIACGVIVCGVIVWLALSVRAVGPLLLGGAAVGGFWAAVATGAGIRWVRRRRARNAWVGPAPIDDPYLYAGLRRRIEACAAAARADRSYLRRPAAADLEYALDWLAAAQDELPGRT
ncbi:hypothetical protein [Actinoplanes sp. GCM10030250]|uniref:hypothetical protein n=1 Tax=Actinoplanes sp. GCM10030250 TaxID=3273376 RepID=UPI00361E7E6D